MKKEKNYLISSFTTIIGLFQKNDFLKKIKKIMLFIDSILILFIPKPRKENNKKKKVLIIYNMAFGDGVIFRRAIANLRKIFPKNKYELTLLCQKGIEYIYREDNFFEQIIPIDFNKSTINIKTRFNNFKLLRSVYYDIILDPVGTNEWLTNIFYTRICVGDKKIGYHDNTINSLLDINSLKNIYSQLVECNISKLHLLDYYLYFFNNLNINKIKIDATISPLKVSDCKFDLPEKYFVVFPSASIGMKQWPIDRFADLCLKIYKKLNIPLVFVGTDVDRDAIEQLKSKIEIPYFDFVSKTSLNDYVFILKNASMVVSNDTSAYHIAIIEGTYSVLIAGGYTYNRYASYNIINKKNLVEPCVVVKKRDCINCEMRCKYLTKNSKIWPCLDDVTTDYAWNLIKKYIEKNKVGEK